jgi:hypothetical protein
MRPATLKAALYLLAVFLGGAAAGATAYHVYQAQEVSAVSPRPSPEEFKKKYVEEMRTRLNLDEEQVRNLRDIMEATRARFTAVKAKHKPELEAIQAQHVNEIRLMLNPGQRQEYEKMRQEREERKRQESAKQGQHSGC